MPQQYKNRQGCESSPVSPRTPVCSSSTTTGLTVKQAQELRHQLRE